MRRVAADVKGGSGRGASGAGTPDWRETRPGPAGSGANEPRATSPVRCAACGANREAETGRPAGSEIAETLQGSVQIANQIGSGFAGALGRRGAGRQKAALPPGARGAHKGFELKSV